MPEAKPKPRLPWKRRVESLTAAAQQTQGPKAATRGRIRRSTQGWPWQEEAWLMLQLVGELQFAVNWKANATSQAKLLAGRTATAGDEPEPITEGPAAAVMAALAGGMQGQSLMLQRLSVHLEVPGDSYLIGEDELDELTGRPTGKQRWTVYSIDEVTQQGDRWVVDIGDNEQRPIAAEAIVLRVWRPDPRKSWEPTSPVRGALPILREIDGLTKHVAATIDSRLAGNGILFMPLEASFPSSEDDDDDEDEFQNELTEGMITPIKDRDAAEAVVPLVSRLPADLIEKVKHMTFWSEFDEHLKELRDDAIRRLALALDMPPEILLGLGDSNHWNGAQVGVDAVRLHIEPVLQIICGALTEGYLRPMLTAMGVPDAEMYEVIYDVTPLLKDEQRSVADGILLYDRFVIGPTGLRQLAGVDESDAPDPATLRDMILLEIVRNGNITPELLELMKLPVTIMEEPKLILGAAADTPAPFSVTGGEPALLDAAEVLCLSAIERAGQRRRNQPGGVALKNVPLHEFHTHLAVVERREVLDLLHGAFTLAGTTATRYGVDPGKLMTALHEVTAETIQWGEPLDRANVASALFQAGICPTCLPTPT